MGMRPLCRKILLHNNNKTPFGVLLVRISLGCLQGFEP